MIEAESTDNLTCVTVHLVAETFSEDTAGLVTQWTESLQCVVGVSMESDA